jgi:hypothetical protein
MPASDTAAGDRRKKPALAPVFLANSELLSSGSSWSGRVSSGSVNCRSGSFNNFRSGSFNSWSGSFNWSLFFFAASGQSNGQQGSNEERLFHL